jgi:ATP-dependent RNA helicase DeaD
MSFTDLEISENIVEALATTKIYTPSNIQTLAYNPILKGDNVWLKSSTGSGKTLAYILPILDKILSDNSAHTQVVFFTPTHELAIQISDFINQTFSKIGIKSLALIGKASIERQKEKLKKKPQIVVGSVGRILELIEQKKLKAAHFKYCIIDEADRMLEEDSLQTIEKVLNKTIQLQYILGSATIKNDALSIAQSFINEVHLLDNIEEKSTIIHSYLMVDNNRKNDTIRSFINAIEPAKILIFLHKNNDVDFVSKKLSYKALSVGSIHGEQDKISRANTIRKFKSGKLKVLVASDVAARGLDINDIDYVINYDIPTKAEDYQHRAGRTGRMGRHGHSVLLCNSSEMSTVAKIQKQIGLEIVQAELSHGCFNV